MMTPTTIIINSIKDTKLAKDSRLLRGPEGGDAVHCPKSLLYPLGLCQEAGEKQ